MAHTEQISCVRITSGCSERNNGSSIVYNDCPLESDADADHESGEQSSAEGSEDSFDRIEAEVNAEMDEIDEELVRAEEEVDREIEDLVPNFG